MTWQIHARKAAQNLDSGDPCEAVEFLNTAIALSHDDEVTSRLYKAKEEARIGNPETAEFLLDDLLVTERGRSL